MLLEKSSKRLQHSKANCDEFDSESLHGNLPQLAKLKPSRDAKNLKGLTVDWFGNQTTFSRWNQSSSNMYGPSTLKTATPRTTPQSQPGSINPLDQGQVRKLETITSLPSPPISPKLRFPSFQPHQIMRNDGLDCGLSVGNLLFKVDQSRHTDACCKKNLHADRCSWVVGDSCESDSFIGDTHKIETREPGRPKSKYNKTHTYKEQYLKRGFVYKPEIIAGREENSKWKKPGASPRCGITQKELMLFTKAIGYKSLEIDNHLYPHEILDYIINSKLVFRACTCLPGSKFLQYQITNTNYANHNDILEQVMEKLIAICNDKYGNHVVQCFFLLNNPDLAKKIVLRIKMSFSALAMNRYGGRVVQRAIMSLNDELLRIVMEAIAPKTYILALDDFGHYLLLQAIERGSGELVELVLANIMRRPGSNSLIKLSKNKNGSKVVQKMLEIANTGDREVIFDAMMGSPRDLLALCKNKYGNYIIQHILNHFPQQNSLILMDLLEDKLLKMAKNKFCSFVIQVLYKHGGRYVENCFIKLLNRKRLTKLLNDQFGQYLVQTMLTKGEPENRMKIQRLLLTIPHLQNLKYGKYVIKLL